MVELGRHLILVLASMRVGLRNGSVNKNVIINFLEEFQTDLCDRTHAWIQRLLELSSRR